MISKADTERLIRRLNTQLDYAEKIDSQWAYITKEDARICLELAEAQDVILDYLSEIKEVQGIGG